MRFVIYSIILLLWCGMWWWTYTCHIKGACCANDGGPEAVLPVEEETFAGRLAFEWKSGEPVTGDKFAVYRDSILAMLEEGRVLVATGLYDSVEGEAVGSNRAKNAVQMMSPNLDTTRYRLESRRVDNLSMVGDSLFEGVTFDINVFNESVRELEDRVLIFFPFNSTEKVEDPRIDAYLDDLAAELAVTDETIKLIGHSDAFGPENENYRLGLWRAEAIRNLLVDKGIDRRRISTESRGEAEPIGDDNTVEGARLNRRVELQIVKE